MNVDQLSPDELKIINAVLARLSERAKFSLSLDRLLHRWDRFVRKVEQGYTESIYEYTNDLSTRDMLQSILLDVADPVRSKLVTLVHPLDDRFNQATWQAGRALIITKNIETAPWWFRIPVRFGGELEDDLRTEGLL